MEELQMKATVAALTTASEQVLRISQLLNRVIGLIEEQQKEIDSLREDVNKLIENGHN